MESVKYDAFVTEFSKRPSPDCYIARLPDGQVDIWAPADIAVSNPGQTYVSVDGVARRIPEILPAGTIVRSFGFFENVSLSEPYYRRYPLVWMTEKASVLIHNVDWISFFQRQDKTDALQEIARSPDCQRAVAYTVVDGVEHALYAESWCEICAGVPPPAAPVIDSIRLVGILGSRRELVPPPAAPVIDSIGVKTCAWCGMLQVKECPPSHATYAQLWSERCALDETPLWPISDYDRAALERFVSAREIGESASAQRAAAPEFFRHGDPSRAVLFGAVTEPPLPSGWVGLPYGHEWSKYWSAWSTASYDDP